MNLEEFQCKCESCRKSGALVYPIPALADAIKMIEEKFGRPIHISSGYRCAPHNEAVGGSPMSRHVQRSAIDMTIPGLELSHIHWGLNEMYPDSMGIGQYNSHIHFDFRPYKARWDYR